MWRWRSEDHKFRPALHGKTLSQRKKKSWEQWLMPIIPGTPEAEVRRNLV
jgi:hypothetical protein